MCKLDLLSVKKVLVNGRRLDLQPGDVWVRARGIELDREFSWRDS